MAERLIEAMDEGLLMDMPFLRKAREKSRAEGRAEGRIEELQKIILDMLTTRLGLTVPQYRRFEDRIEALTDENRLRSLLQTAILAGDVAEFEASLAAVG